MTMTNTPYFAALWCCATALLSATAHAITLEPVNVSAGTATATSLHLHAVTTITRSDILASPAKHLADLLAQDAGVDTRRRGAPASHAAASNRGSHFEHSPPP